MVVLLKRGSGYNSINILKKLYQTTPANGMKTQGQKMFVKNWAQTGRSRITWFW